MLTAHIKPVIDFKNLICTTCKRSFTTAHSAERHIARKIPCYERLVCKKCNKSFNGMNNYVRHINRKTSCRFLHDDPTKKIGKLTCKWCFKSFSTKSNLTKHQDKACKVNNGNRNILFDKLHNRLVAVEKEFKQLRSHPKHIIDNMTVVNNIQTNHINNTLKINFLNFSKHHTVIQNILQSGATEILGKNIIQDVPLYKQVSDRVVNLVGLVFRNPEHKDMQGIYVVNLDSKNHTAYVFDDGQWKVSDWNVLRTQVLEKLFNVLSVSKENKRADLMNIIKYLFALGPGNGKCSSVSELKSNEILEIYRDIGSMLRFSSIAE